MKYYRSLIFSSLLIAPAAFADLYIGGNGGLSYYGSNVTDEYNISSTGSTYGAIVGYKVQFVGFEFLYQNIKTKGDIKHSGTKYQLNSDTTVLGGAVRFNFNFFYLRAGYGRYSTEQSVLRDGTTVNSPSINRIYEINTSGESGSGFVGGGGLQYRMNKNFRIFADYTRYNLSAMDAHYNTFTAGLIISLPNVVTMRLKSD